MALRLLVGTALAFTICVFANVSLAQSPPQDISAGTCTGCQVRVERLFAVGGVNSPIGSKPAGVFRDRLGRSLILPSTEDALSGDSLVALIDSGGRVLRHLARRGLGPGELGGSLATMPIWIDAGSDDTVRIFMPSRISLYHGRELRFARHDNIAPRLETQSNIVRLPGGSLAVVPLLYDTVRINPRTGATIYTAIALRDPTGRVTKDPIAMTFGVEKSRSKRATRVAAGTGFLVASTINVGDKVEPGYRIAFFSDAGILTRVMRRMPAFWMQAPPVTASASGVPRPATSIQAVRQAASGLILVSLAQPDSEWRDVDRADRYAMGHYSAVVEVIDPRDSRLVGTATVRGMPVSFADDRTLVTYYQDANGVPYLEFWSLTAFRR